jgi:hypothetical protein
MKTNMKHISTFDNFLTEAKVYGMFNDSQGKPSKLSTEILDIVLKGLPKYVVNNIEEVEAAGYSKVEMATPSTISNKGQSRGYADYTSIIVIFKNPMGSSKTTHLEIGLRKRTSGPGTGYIALKPTSNYNQILPNRSVAIEFYDDPAEALGRLFSEQLNKIMK